MAEQVPSQSSLVPAPIPGNRLFGQISRYYLLHQHQPVAWQPWSDETFQLAQKYNKPILLSIGYSACHWCHVMSRDSFEDVETASLMNEYFISVCVDREERPDIDGAYQLAHLLLNGHSGGWPLISFLCPHTRLPFFASTYLSQQSTTEKLGFPQLLQKVHDYYQQQQKDLRRLLVQLGEGVKRITFSGQDSKLPDRSLAAEALTALAESQDNVHGGFGSSPKFPQPVNLSFLLYAHTHSILPLEQLGHLTHSLTLIAERGINDRISGGFYRYSVDEAWTVPHFEKMLYDNGLLLEVYARAYEQFQDPLYKSSVNGIVRWLRRYMESGSGAFYSSVDADAEGIEGGHYLLSSLEIEQTLSTEEFHLFTLMFAIEPSSDDAEMLHLGQVCTLGVAAEQLCLTRASALNLYQSGRRKLEQLRHNNPQAGVDKKILTGWNALVVKGLAISSRATEDKTHLRMAQRSVDFIRLNLWLNKRLFACWQDGRVARHAFLDDYVYLIESLLELLQLEWRDADYRFLLAVTESMLHFHQDSQGGGLFYSAVDTEQTFFPNKPFMDNVLPSANGVAARVLLRLGHLSAEPRYSDCAEEILKAGSEVLKYSPLTHLSLVQALAEQLQPLPIVIMLDDGSIGTWVNVIREQFGERLLCFCLPVDAELCPPNALHLEPGEAVVSVGDECSVVVQDLLDLQKLLAGLPELQ